MSENVSSVTHPPFSPHTRTPPLSRSPSTPLLEPHISNPSVYTPPITSQKRLVAITDDESPLQAVSSSTPFRSTWKPSRSARRFSPLTPIIASPLSSPAASMSHEVVFGLGSGSEDEKDQNSVHAGGFAAYAEITSNPTWISTPPTPLLKYAHKPSASVTSPRCSSFVTASASFPDTALSSVSKTPPELTKRPSSFPVTSVAKLSPAIPRTTTSLLETLRDNSNRQGTHSSRSLLHMSNGERGGERSYLSRKPSPQGVKPSFHMPHDGSDKDDDDEFEGLGGYSKDSLGGEETSPEVPNDPTLAKDGHALGDARKCYALLELLSTEVDYFIDLKILVNVYLRLLPDLTTRPSHSHSPSLGISHFSRSTHPSFSTSTLLNPSSRTSSFPHLSTAVPPSLTLIFCEGTPPTVTSPPVQSKEKDKTSMRQILSSSDIELITRNAEDILKFHEQLVYELRTLVSSLGFLMVPDESGTFATGIQKHSVRRLEVLGSALDAVALKFIERAPGFDLYQSFCSKHAEADSLVRKLQQEFPSEWDTFEQKCAAMATEIRTDSSLHFGMDTEAGNDRAVDDSPRESDLHARRRRHSLSSLHALSRQQSLSRVRSNTNLKTHVLNASESGHSDLGRSEKNSKLVFKDYLIKPVQRICRYPLLLDQLHDHPRGVGSSRKPSSTSNAEGRAPDMEVNVVQSALITMRAVANSVDEAQYQQDLAMKSSLILSRISRGLALVTSSHGRPASRNLSPGFMSSLGSCRLAGSLDVIHYHGFNANSSGTVKAKYLGAFLYAGGYLILAKVHKVRMYEPRHWFSLAGFDLVDSTEDEALLPSWFRLYGRGHIFEFAASCRREKDIWKAAIRHVLELPGEWIGEPLCSFQADSQGDFISSLVDDTSYEAISSLPTIQSIPELDIEMSTCGDEKHSPSGPSDQLKSGRVASGSDHQLGPSRRSSTKQESDTIHLVRATPLAREQVDHGLADVFSGSCLSARYYAHTHEEELFEASKVSRPFSRSNSGLAMANAMSVAAKNRLTKRESVFVPRRKSYVDGLGHYDISAHWGSPAKPGKRPKIIAVSKAESLDGDEGGLETPLESPSAMSHFSSAPVYVPEPVAASPTAGPGSSSILSGVPSRPELASRREALTPKRSHSKVENVGVLFSRPPSPTIAPFRELSESSIGAPTQGLLKWLSKGTFRRRVRSAPDVPVDEFPSDATAGSLMKLSSGSHPSMPYTDHAVSQSDTMHPVSYPQMTAGLVTGIATSTPAPVRKRSLFGPQSLRRRSTTTTSASSTPDSHGEGSIPRTVRIRRNLSFLSRLSPITPDDVLQK